MSKYIDNININDEIGPHGLVIIKDKAGNILVKKHNMVVEDGKKIVYNKLLETSGFSQGKDIDSNWKLAKLYFGNSMNETTYNYSEINRISSTQDGKEVIYYSYNLFNESSGGYTSIVSFSSTNDGHPYIEFNLSGILCDPEKAAYLSCLSVVAEEIVTNNSSGTRPEKLFSRIKFDPIPMVEGNELTLLYYIYF